MTNQSQPLDSKRLESAPSNLIAYDWAESLSDGEQSVLLTSSLRRLQKMIDTALQQPATGKQCVKCGHSRNDPKRRGMDEYSSFCVYGCGCKCDYGEGLTGCADDNDELSRALRQISPERLNQVLAEELPNRMPNTSTTSEVDFNWALRELADGWIDNSQREGPYGFYGDARANAIREAMRAVSPVLIAHYDHCTNSVNAGRWAFKVDAALQSLLDKKEVG